MTVTVHTMDLTPSDVHVDSVGTKAKAKMKPKKPLSKKAKSPVKGVRVRAHLGAGGSLHIRHLRDGAGDVAILSGVELDATGGGDTAKPVWIQLAKPGSFKGHGAGAFELNATIFSQIVANFHATINKRIAIDFNHASEQEPTAGTNAVLGTPAQGWILDMKIDGGNLWGLVQWGELARQYIREGGYRFFSPAIRFNSRDRVTGQPVGARMSSGALTNDPFLDGLVPVAASFSQAAAPSSDTLPAIRRGLGLSTLAGAAECAAEFERLCDALEAGGGEDIHGIPVAAVISALMTEMRAPLTMDLDDFVEAIQGILDNAQGDIETESDDIQTTDSSGALMTASEESTTMTLEEAVKQIAAEQIKVSEATLKLNAACAEVVATKAIVAERDAAIASLTKDKEAREELDLTAEVDSAIMTWGTRKGVSDKDRGHLLSFRKASPDGFKALYPEENPVHTRLMSRVTPPVARDAAPEAIVADGETFSVTLSRVRKENPKLSTNAAYDKAYKLRNT